jgi:hypothetical protein
MSLLDAYNKAMAQLRADVNDVVHNDMRDGIAIAMVDSARTRVYDAYNPQKYQRRMTLIDPSHYVFQNEDMGITVESPITGNPAYAPPASSGWNPGNISHIIESGNGYPWLSKGSDMDRIGPRPYLTEGMKDYVNTRADADLADGLRARGYIVE